MSQVTLKELKDLWYRLALQFPERNVSIVIEAGKPRIVIE